MVDLGTNSGTSAVVAVTVAQPVPAGELVIVVLGGGRDADEATVTDTAGSEYLAAAVSNSANNWNALAAIRYALLPAPLDAGDTVTATFNASSPRNVVWVLHARDVQVLDQQAASDRDSSPSVTAQGSVTSATGLVIAATLTASSTLETFSAPAAYMAGPVWSSYRSSGIFAWQDSTTLTGRPVFAPPVVQRDLQYLSAIAVFKAGTPRTPAALALSHTDNSRNLSVSWSGGEGTGGVGGATVEYRDPTNGNWDVVANVNADVSASGQSLQLPGDGWVNNWNGPVEMRLVRRWDGTVLGVFPQSLECTTAAASTTPTGSTDEDCDGNWDNVSCTAYAWTSSTVYQPPASACVNVNPAATIPCDGAHDGDTRYTATTQTTSGPDAVSSYGSQSQTCTGAADGAVRWTCTGSGCTHQ
ncbi:MAG: hypothetical protein HY904_00660 [Deltaproteobacteria bacterium]|nr:hypothetical protein [Deltaproteobacteria bacterium]